MHPGAAVIGHRYGKALAAAKMLPPYCTTVLSLAVSHSIFLYEVMGSHEAACRAASDAFSAARHGLEATIGREIVEQAMEPMKVRVSCGPT